MDLKKLPALLTLLAVISRSKIKFDYGNKTIQNDMKRVVWTVTVTKQVCKGCVPVYTTFKLIELERLGCSGFEAN